MKKFVLSLLVVVGLLSSVSVAEARVGDRIREWRANRNGNGVAVVQRRANVGGCANGSCSTRR